MTARVDPDACDNKRVKRCEYIFAKRYVYKIYLCTCQYYHKDYLVRLLKSCLDANFVFNFTGRYYATTIVVPGLQTSLIKSQGKGKTYFYT